MKLHERVMELFRDGRTPILPTISFPFVQLDETALALEELARDCPLAGLGLAYPGRTVLPGLPGRRPRSSAFSDWDLFQFMYYLKSRTALPIVMAVHYQDLVGFGVIPYVQEGHKVGLDALILKGVPPDETEFLSSELLQGGIGWGACLSGSGSSDDEAVNLDHLSVLVILAGETPWRWDGLFRSPCRRVHLFLHSSLAGQPLGQIPHPEPPPDVPPEAWREMPRGWLLPIPGGKGRDIPSAVRCVRDSLVG